MMSSAAETIRAEGEDWEREALDGILAGADPAI
jgi:hypothetical protein